MTEDEYGYFYSRTDELIQDGATKQEIAGRLNMPISFIQAIIDELKVRHEA